MPAGGRQGWQNPIWETIPDVATRTAFQDVRDYLGPYSMQLSRSTTSQANQAAAAVTKIQFNTLLDNTGDKLKRSTDTFGVIIPWAGLWNVQLTATLEFTAAGATGAVFYIWPQINQFDEVTGRKQMSIARVSFNPALDPYPALHTSNTVTAVAGDRIYGYSTWTGVGGAPTAHIYGNALPDIWSCLTVTYVGKI